MVHRSVPIPFAKARICIDSATVTRDAARMMAQAVAAREQCYEHRSREPIDGKVICGSIALTWRYADDGKFISGPIVHRLDGGPGRTGTASLPMCMRLIVGSPRRASPDR